jgi:branched-chain amino acid transport system substrate-binding protein
MRRWPVVFTVLCLFVLIVFPACGGSGGEKTSAPKVTPSSTASVSAVPTITPTETLTSTPTITPNGTVKIGAVGPWSGSMAVSGLLADSIISLVESQVNNSGGILGGREIKFVRGDDRGVVAESSAQAEKLILNDKVSMLTLGGISAASITATADIAENYKVPFVGFASIYKIATRQYCACLYSHELVIGRIAHFITDVAKPKSIGWLAYNVEDAHQVIDGIEGVEGLRHRLEVAGIDIVYEQYFPQDVMDFSNYLTKIKYVKPDLLVSELNGPGQAVTINKQIAELGGWGDIKYFSATEASAAKAALALPSALGTYQSALWLPDSDDVGMKAFYDDFSQKYGRAPTADLTYYYNVFWTAIKAIEFAGSDEPIKVAQALRSGNLEWDSAWGHLRIGTNGIGDTRGIVAKVSDGGKLVKVWPQ